MEVMNLNYFENYIEQFNESYASVNIDDTTYRSAVHTSIQTRKKNKHFVYPCQNKILKPENFVSANDLMRNASILEMCETDSCNPCQETSMKISDDAGAVVFDELYSKILSCNSSSILPMNVKRKTFRYMLLDFSDNRTIRIARMIFNEFGSGKRNAQANVDDDGIIVQRLRKLSELNFPNHLIRCLYVVYLLTSGMHFGNYEDILYKRRFLAYSLVRAERRLPLVNFSFDIINDMLEFIVNHVHLIDSFGIPIYSLYVQHSKALRVLSLSAADRECDDVIKRSRFRKFNNSPRFNCDRKNFFDERLDGNMSAIIACNFGGFVTAGGKRVIVDRECSVTADNLFKDMFDADANTNANASQHESAFFDLRLAFPSRRTGIRSSCARFVNEHATLFSKTDRECSNLDGFKTSAGKIINIRAESFEASVKTFQGIYDEHERTSVHKCSGAVARARVTSATDTFQTDTFDLDREITESTSAFLFDVSDNDEKTRTFSSPSQSPVNRYRSGSSSPILDAKLSKRTKCCKRKRLMPLDKICSMGEETKRFSCYDIFEMSVNTAIKKPKLSLSIVGGRLSNELAEQCIRLAVEQQHFVDNKPTELCTPRKGYLSTRIVQKTEERVSLKQAAALCQKRKPKTYSVSEYLGFGLLPAVVRVTSRNAREFVFKARPKTNSNSDDQRFKSNEYSVLCGDAADVVWNVNNEITFDEIARAFLASPGVDPKFISLEWIANHYRWIVWKLASTERSFPSLFGGSYLTLDNVLFQLKFRYDQEIDNCNRSALKRILEGDDSPARTLVLCIADIKQVSDSLQDYQVELTDGWYSIIGDTDKRMVELIKRKTLVVGSKLIITGAELIGCNQGCDPLQIPPSTRLKFSTNSSRRVRWYTRLGFYNNPPPLSTVHALFPNGGFVAQLAAAVARVYPILFLEKTTDISSPGGLHNEKAEFKKIAKYDRDRLTFVETILSQVTHEILRENNVSTNAESSQFCTITGMNDYQYTDGRENDEKLNALIQERIASRLSEKFSEIRKVSRLLKLRLVDLNAGNKQTSSSAILTIWNPSEDVIAFFKEGKAYTFYSINTTGIRHGDLQLSSIRSSRYDTCSLSTSLQWCDRRLLTAKELSATDDDIAMFGEVDVIGIVVKIRLDEYGRRFVYFSDSQQNFFAVSFCTSEKNFDYGDTINCCQMVVGFNLQRKKDSLRWNIPILYASEYTSFTLKNHVSYLQIQINEFLNHFENQNVRTFITECEKKLNEITPLCPSSALISSNGTSNEHCSSLVVTSDNQAYNHNLLPTKLVNQFDGHRIRNEDSGSRIEKLQNYREPPSLSPITLTSRTNIKKFKSLHKLSRSSR